MLQRTKRSARLSEWLERIELMLYNDDARSTLTGLSRRRLPWLRLKRVAIRYEHSQAVGSGLVPTGSMDSSTASLVLRYSLSFFALGAPTPLSALFSTEDRPRLSQAFMPTILLLI
jgi:hypothetical protein